MGNDAALAQFVRTILPGDEQAQRIMSAQSIGELREVIGWLVLTSAPDAMPTDVWSNWDALVTYMITSRAVPIIDIGAHKTSEQWYERFDRLLTEELNGVSPAQPSSNQGAGSASSDALSSVMLLFLPRILDVDHALMLIEVGDRQRMLMALKPEVARCWDGVAIPIGDTQIVVSSALDAAEDYILAERPDLAMLLRGTPPRIAEPGQSCPALVTEG